MYIYLKRGEVIIEGEEYLSLSGKWVKSVFSGCTFGGGKMRRSLIKQY